MRLERLAKDPLVHFLLIGAGLFGFYALIGGNDGQPGSTIEITMADVERLRAGWIREHGAPATRAQLDALVEEEIRQEVLYREALSLGLDEGDTVIRKRLAEKMEFFAEDEGSSHPSTATAGADRKQALFDELAKKYEIIRPEIDPPSGASP